MRLEEAKSINSSLSALGNVIAALSSTHRNYIPYRSSKLTRALQNSLNADSRVAVIATISQSPSNINETISTLMFASRCRDIHLKPQLNSYVNLDPAASQADEYMKKMQDHVYLFLINLQSLKSSIDGQNG